MGFEKVKKYLLSCFLALLCFIAYAIFPLQSPKLYNSPDDQANAFFITHFVEQGELWFREPLNLEVEGRVVPRSMRAIGDRVVPIGFPGLPLIYGTMAKVTGLGMMNLFTPLLVAISVAMLYLAVRKRYGDWTALIAAIAYGAHPAIWYYASRGLYPNAPVVALVVIAVCGAMLLDGALFSFLFSLPIALAVLIRPIELIWILPVIILLARKQWIGVLIGIAMALIANHWVYGAWFSTGYSASLAAPDAVANTSKTVLKALWYVMSFGIMTFPLQSLGSVAAWVFLMSRREIRERYGMWLMAALGLVCVIVFPYALFGAHDLVLKGIPTIGTSFVRYWMPAYLIGAVMLIIVAASIKSRAIVIIGMTVYIASSLYAVWFGTPDSLVRVTQSLLRYQGVKATAEKLIEPEAIIICEQADKIFFPDHRVVAWLRNPGTYEAIPKLLDAAPVYYYGITFPPADIETLYKEKLPKGVKIEAVQTFDNETLYRFTR